MTKAKPPVLPTIPDRPPSPREVKAIKDSDRRVSRRRQRVRIKSELKDGNTLCLGPNYSDALGHLTTLLDAFGTSSETFMRRQVSHLAEIAALKDGQLVDTELNAMVAMVDGARPDDEIQAALAVQIAATHTLSLIMMKKAAQTTNRPFLDSYVTAATKLQRTMVAQAEALAKVRRKGEQNVTVKHVHVHKGGQAIVGNVRAGGRRGQGRNQGKPHEITHTPSIPSSEALRGEEQAGEAVPVPGGAWEDAL